VIPEDVRAVVRRRIAYEAEAENITSVINNPK
jgi:hypothetical protein